MYQLSLLTSDSDSDPVGPIDAAFFARYDGEGREAAGLGGAANKHADAEATVAKEQEQMDGLKAQMESNQVQRARLQKSIDHPGVCSCMGASFEQKQEALAEAKAEVPKLVKEIEAIEKQLKLHTAEMKRLGSADHRKDKLQADRGRLFEGAVATAPTDELKRLQADAADAQERIDFDERESEALKQAGELCKEAAAAFRASGDLLGKEITSGGDTKGTRRARHRESRRSGSAASRLSSRPPLPARGAPRCVKAALPPRGARLANVQRPL